MIKRASALAALVVVLGLSGCASSPSPVEPPAELTDFKPALSVEPLWRAQLGNGAGTLQLRMAPSYSHGMVYAAARTGLVRAYAAETGRRAWSNDLGVSLGTGPVVAGDLLLLGGDAEVIALDRATGDLRWRAAVSSEVIAEPVRNGDLVIARTVDGGMFALSSSDGRRIWRSPEQKVPLLTLRGQGAPLVVIDTVIAGYGNGRVAAFDLRNGRLLWETPISMARGRTELERLTDVDGKLFAIPEAVFAVGFQGRVAALSVADGRVAWNREISSYQGLAAAGRNLYLSDAEGNVWALAQRNGTTLWRQTALRGRDLTTPVVQGKAILVGDYDGYVHWLSREDGHFMARARVMNPAETLRALPLLHEYAAPPDVPGSRQLVAPPVVAGDLAIAMDRSGALSVFRVGSRGTKP